MRCSRNDEVVAVDKANRRNETEARPTKSTGTWCKSDGKWDEYLTSTVKGEGKGEPMCGLGGFEENVFSKHINLKCRRSCLKYMSPK